MQITDELIQTVAEFKQELYNRLDKIRQLEQTRKEVVNYFGRARKNSKLKKLIMIFCPILLFYCVVRLIYLPFQDELRFFHPLS